MASSLPRLLVPGTISFAFALALTVLPGALAPAAAQTVVGDVRQPAVTVDLGVLDSLGPAPTLPDVLRGRVPERRRVATRHAPVGKHATKRKRAEAKRKHPAPVVAARPAKPIKPVAVAPGAPAVPRESVAATALPTPAATPTAPAAPSAPTTPETPAAAAPTAAAAAPAAPATAPATTAAAAPAGATTPTVAPPRPVPTAAPSPAAETAMTTPPAVAPAPVTPTPVAPAAAPAAVAPAAADLTRILFPSGDAELPDPAKAQLDAVVQRLNADTQARLQLIAHAAGTADQANQARRVSLQRALAVRSYLMERGIANTRMDVRALGNRTDSDTTDSLDRVDVVVLSQ
jgi:outer membrane protein OmpA-like peptidoglycan-associated protein